jgi:hypothetical protein
MDLSFVLAPAIQVLSAVALGAASAMLSYGIGWVKKRTQLEDAEFEKVLADRANDIVHRGIAYAISALENEVKKQGSGITAVKVDNIFLRIAMDYIRSAMPDIIKKFNLTPDRVRDMILARIGDYASQVKVEGAAATGTAVADAVAAKPSP